MAVGKRTSSDQPLTEHDIAERLDKAALRCLRILSLARNYGFHSDVRESRYLSSGLLEGLAAELRAWGITVEGGCDE